MSDEPLTIENALEVAETWSWLIDAGFVLPDKRDDETDGQWTDRIHRSGNALGRNRQCSIGWHGECSDPDGDECACPCHKLNMPSWQKLAITLGWFRDALRAAVAPSVPDSPSTALQDAPGANERGLVANEATTSGVLATWMTVDAGTDHEHEAWVPWPQIPAVASSAVLPPMHCRDENGKVWKLAEISRSGWLSHDESGDMVTTNMARNERPANSAPLYRLTEVEP